MFLCFWFFTCCPHPFSFRNSLFIKSPYVSLCSCIHYVQTYWLWKAIHTSKIKHTHFKIYTRMKCLQYFFFFSSRDETSSLSFWQRWVHPGMKFHLGKKRLNSKRHFTLDRDEFVRGRVSSQDEISPVNTP